MITIIIIGLSLLFGSFFFSLYLVLLDKRWKKVLLDKRWKKFEELEKSVDKIEGVEDEICEIKNSIFDKKNIFDSWIMHDRSVTDYESFRNREKRELDDIKLRLCVMSDRLESIEKYLNKDGER